MTHTSPTAALAALAAAIACHAPLATDAREEPRWAAPDLQQSISIRDGHTDRVLSLDELLDELAAVDAVFLGETHTDETTHRVEFAIYDGLLERRHGQVVLALEMFERDVQEHLDAYVSGAIDEATFLEHARPWSNYREAYRPLIERAKRAGSPALASNFPRPLRMAVMREGVVALEGARDAPAELHPNTPAYWRRVDNAIRGHRGMMGSGDAEDRRLTSTQSLWDNAMGDTCARALADHPGASVLHVNGGFHSAYWDGTVHQLRLRRAQASVATVAITPVANPAVAELGGAPIADYVVFVEARATDLHDGTRSVWVSRELEYRFHLPEGASAEAPVPLLIWLGDDGLTAEDGLDLWQQRLGDEVAIAVLEAPTVETQEDLGLGGRWFRSDTFASDASVARSAVERTWGYLLRHHPIDPSRVCLAGEGTGATMAATSTVFSDRLGVSAIALAPRSFAKIKDLPLPLPELRGDDVPPEQTLYVFVDEKEAEWWRSEIEEYIANGLDAALIPAGDDPWTIELDRENVVRAALGLDARLPASSAERRHVLLEDGTPRARHWARMLASRYAREHGGSVAVLDEAPAAVRSRPIAVGVRPDTLAVRDAIPLCPGPFGGTTVLVVGDDVSNVDAEAWHALEDDDPLTTRSRFHRLRVADLSGEASLSVVLERLSKEGRGNVLVIPAAFCAPPETMRAMRRSVRKLEDRMTLHWLPGLGGGLGP